MKLTDELRAQMVSALKQSFPRMTAAGWEPELTERECVIAAAAYRAGAEDMRERAAAVLAGVIQQWMDVFPLSDVIEANRVRAVIDAIRALGVDDE